VNKARATAQPASSFALTPSIWAGFGELEWTKIKDRITQSRISTIYRACKEWFGWTGKRGCFARMKFAALLEFRSAVEGRIDGCSPAGKLFWMCCREELSVCVTLDAPFHLFRSI
jgi:hypothetical protein